ncbi:STM4015 family protein [Streptomyces tagetis]|uniref:STM4015 family protein n=1 Tax=Streptomyces tagetis TaxID=2820809 RepID=A0A940XEM8_9ACTN|nr:STM4015 family protein [Streptomyces sp. RG38]MBQ0827040.1 STM4015 family protein [Streptomyces sp. RG38]
MRHPATHLTTFHGLPVRDFPVHPERPSARRRPPPPAASVAWRLSCAWSEEPIEFETVWRRFHEEVRTEEVTAVLIGSWWTEWDEHGIDPVLERITADAHRLPALRALFLADVGREEWDISWLRQGEVTRVLRAWPDLAELGVRGADGLVVEPLRHEGLRTLRVESGGLPREPVRALAACDFPGLREIDLWLGTSGYGGSCRPGEVDALLASLGRYPGLRRLGLCNSDIQDQVAAAVSTAPLVAGLESLDLGMGTLGDEGGGALLAGRPLSHLAVLDLDHHFMSEPMTRRLRDTLAPHGVRLALEPAYHAGVGGRYVAVGE